MYPKIILIVLCTIGLMNRANAQCTSCSYTDNGTSNSYNLSSGQTLCITSGTYSGSVNINGSSTICIASGASFTGSIQNANASYTMNIYGSFTGGLGGFPSGSNINVQSTGTFTPSTLNNPSGTITNKGTANFNNSFSFNSGTQIINYGTFNISTNPNANGAITWINERNAVMNFASGANFVLANSSTYTNYGKIYVTGNFNTNSGTTFTNYNLLKCTNTFNPSGNVTNYGIVYAIQFINLNSGANVVNYCRFLTNVEFNNNATSFSNYGLIWDFGTGSGTVIVQNNAAFYQGASGVMRGINYTNNSTVTGSGNYYFTGTTNNQGPFGNDGNGINFYDTSYHGRANGCATLGSCVFDVQSTTPGSTVTKNAIPPADTIGMPPNGCSTTYDSSKLYVSGTIYDDANGNTDATVNGTAEGIIASHQLYAYLLNSSNVIIDSSIVHGNGAYYLFAPNSGTNYTVSVSTTQATVGSTGPYALTSGLVFTGGNYGTNNGAGSGNTSPITGKVAANVGTTFISGLNFGIDQLPTDNSYTQASQANPDGSSSVTVTSTDFTGTDADGSISNIKITAFPANVVSITINSTTYTSSTFPAGGVTVPAASSGNPTQTIKVLPSNGALTVKIPYVTLDNANQQSLAIDTVSMPFTDISINGTIYDDANGMTDNIVNGTAEGTIGGNQVYAYLLNTSGTILDTVHVHSNGTYSFNGGTGVSKNTNYIISVSTTQAVVGSTGPSSLATTLVNTGSTYGTNNGAGSGNDATVNGKVSANVGTTSVTGVNFGIDQLPTDNSSPQSTQLNPGGIKQVTVPSTAFSGTDADGFIDSIKIVAFPAKATTIVINGTSYTSSTFPSKGVTIPANTSGNPTQTITVDPQTGPITVKIPYVTIDNAHQSSYTVDTAALPFSGLNLLSGIVYHDANGLTDGIVNGTGIGVLSGIQLYAQLVDSGSHIVVATTAVNDSGKFQFTNIMDENWGYRVELSITPGVIGNAPTPGLTGLWRNVGDNYGINNGYGTGVVPGTPSDTINLHLSTASITSIAFGIEEAPYSYSKIYNNLSGFVLSVGSGNIRYPYKISLAATANDSTVNVAGVSPGVLSGLDAEDGRYSGATGSSGHTVIFTTLPDSSTTVLVYYDGTHYDVLLPGGNMLQQRPENETGNVPTTRGQAPIWNATTQQYSIANFNQNNLLLYGQTGVTTATFTYAWLDAAAIQGPSSVYELSFSSPLPVQLSNFEATKESATTILTWTTASEENSSYFEVERSSDGYTFNKIGKIQAVGHSTDVLNYNLTDATPLQGVNYYRLRMVDRDSSTKYSDIQSVTFDNNAATTEIKAYPNPARGTTVTLQVTTSANVEGTIAAYNIIGEQMHLENITFNAGVNNTLLDISKLPSGIYEIRITINGQFFNNKIEVIH